MLKHIFFDMDGTVTRTRSPIADDLKQALESLKDRGLDVIIVSGQSTQAIQSQVGVGTYFLGQNGNHAVEPSTGKVFWHNVLSETEKREVMDHIMSMPRIWRDEDIGKHVEDRHSQVALSIIGFGEDITKKESFDPGGAKRTELLKQHPLTSDTVEVKIAGTTTLDYFKKGSHKGSNIQKLIELLDWKKEECVYIGDQLYPGGNDEAVLGVIDTREVQSPAETLEFIKTIS